MSYVLRIIANTDAIYISYHPHRHFPNIAELSIPFQLPHYTNDNDNDSDDDSDSDHDNDVDVNDSDNDDDDDDDESIFQGENVELDEDMEEINNKKNKKQMKKTKNNKNDGDWNSVDTGNLFSHFEMNDIVVGWYDDDYYTAKIVEVDSVNELFTLLFFDDGMEVDSYRAQWLKHIQ